MAPDRPPSPPPRRRGLGATLMIVLSVTLVLFSFGLATSFQGRGVTGTVQRSVYNDLCEGFATTALRETVHRLRAGALDPDSAAYAFLRSAEFPQEMEVPLAALPWTGEHLAGDPRFTLRGGGVRVRLLRRSLSALEREERVDYEALGVVRVTAVVEGPRRSSATWVEEYGLRAVLTSLPRPFDSPTFFMADPRVLLTRHNWHGDANVAIELAVKRLAEFQRILGDVSTGFEELAAKIRDLIDEAGESNAEADEALRICDELAVEFAEASRPPTYPSEGWTLHPPDSPTDEDPRAIHTFHPRLTIHSYADSLDLGKLGLPVLLEPITRELTEKEPELERIAEEFRARVDAEEPNFPAIEVSGDAYREAILAHTALLERTLGIYKEFQDLLVESGGAAREFAARRFRRFALRSMAWKATYRFFGEGAAARAEAFLRGPPWPQGVLMVDDPDDVLDLDLDGLRGRLVIASSGDVRISRATVADPEQDVLAVIAGGALEVEGPVHAGLACPSERYRSEGRSFAGSLVLDGLTATSPFDLIFSGTLERQPALQTGVDMGGLRPPPDPRAVHVALSPEPLYRRLQR